MYFGIKFCRLGQCCSCELFYFILLLDHGEVIYVVCLCILVCETNYSSEKGRNTENIADADRSGL